MKSWGVLLLLFLPLELVGGNSRSKDLKEDTSKVLTQEEELLLASEDKNADRVNALLEEKAGSDWKEKGKASKLHWAVHTGRRDIVKYVLGNLRGEDGQRRLLDYVWYKVKVPVLLSTLQHKDMVNAVSWSPDGSKICKASRDKTAQVWNVDGSKGATLEHKGWVNVVSWSSDGSKICTGSRDGRAQVWNVDGSRGATLEHNKVVNAVSWSPDGSKICMGSRDGTAQVWEVAGGTVLDWAVRGVCAGGDIGVLDELLSMDEYGSLEGKYSDGLLVDLCHAASRVSTQPAQYERVCKVIEMLAAKPGVPL